LIEEIYKVGRVQMEVRVFKEDYPFWSGGDIWDVQWVESGVRYRVDVEEDNIISTISIVFTSTTVTAQEVIDCIGQAPEHYRASYRLELPPDALRYYRAIFIMSFTSLGIVTTSHETSLQPFTPFVNEHTPIGALVFIEPGSPQQVFNRAFGLPDEAELSFEPQPWPGSWDAIQFVGIRVN
jgi:hypothetical protein